MTTPLFNQKRTVKYQSDPLFQIQWQGLHLIEASAGTGKTWTLSSLMVRLFAEKYWTQQVIATTFTRAATAELKERIRLRLQSVYQLALSWQVEHLNIAEVQQQLQGQVLEYYLFEQFYLQKNGRDNLYLINRLRVVLDTLDELFVGTIDSFVQKILKEFAFESGSTLNTKMTERQDEIIYQLIHDILRQWIQQQSPELIEQLVFAGVLKQPQHYLPLVKDILNFPKAKILEPKIQDENILSRLNDIFQQILNADLLEDEQLKLWYDLDGIYIQSISGTSFRGQDFNQIFTVHLAGLIEEIRLNKTYFEMKSTHLQAIRGLFYTTKGDLRKDIFKGKNKQELKQQFLSLSSVELLWQLVETINQLGAYFERYDQYIGYYLCQQVKLRLPELLNHLGETTFNHQTQRLHDALHSEQGESLAAAIAQRYPLILVDEFQDTNQEQDDILKLIWRNPQRLSQNCFIAVGDPKQAIYGFRGGDILTYFNAFNDIAEHQGGFYRLSKNFRSTPALVQVVDALLQRQPNFGEQVEYYHAEVGKEHSELLFEHHQVIAPLRAMVLDSEQQQHEADLIAMKIAHLLQDAAQGNLYFALDNQPDQRKQVVQPSDIAVLAEKHNDLESMEKALQKQRIEVQRISRSNVFSSVMAQELLATLAAIQRPEQESVLKRGLLSSLIGVKFDEVLSYQMHSMSLEQHIQAFRKTRQLWLEQGFMVAWQWFAEHYQVWQQLAKNTGRFAERHIVNLQHLVQILIENTQARSGIQHCLDWFSLKINHPPYGEQYVERPLSASSGVQLMTIHGSKGLEFKIVFLMKANVKSSSGKSKLIFFQNNHENSGQRIIALDKDQIEHNTDILQQHEEKRAAEEHRKWYVALTRASHRMYLVLHENNEKNQNSKKKSTENHVSEVMPAVGFWLYNEQGVIDFEHQGYVVDHIDSNDKPQQKSWVFADSSSQKVSFHAQPLPKTRFLPKTRTSFTTLTNHHTARTHDVWVENAEIYRSADDEIALLEIEEAPQNIQELTWIASKFARGTQAGNCLHELLEHLDFQDDEHWADEIQHQLQQYQLWNELIEKWVEYQYPDDHSSQIKEKVLLLQPTEQRKIKQQLISFIMVWLKQILHTPFNAEGFCLAKLPASQRMAELAFSMALADRPFPYQEIQHLFEKYDIHLAALQKASTARFLNGAIDLVFFDGEKYHVADFKSNYLGEKYSDYHKASLAKNMTLSSYWLQAAIYLVALHRYLRQAIAHYDINQHLGSVYYLYLRGMNQDDAGVYHWQAPTMLIEQLDQLFGYMDYPTVDKSV